MINDWAFLGNDISTVEQKYEKFERYNKREDGSGYAVLMTEQITGREMYDSNDYSCYNPSLPLKKPSTLDKTKG